jgi:hypothetical protein
MGVGARGGKTRWRNGNELGNVLAESGLVVFDGQQIMRSVFPDQLPGGFVLGVERVQGSPASGQVQLAEKRARHRDFIGFGVHQRATQIEGDGAQDGVAGAVAGFFVGQHLERCGEGSDIAALVIAAGPGLFLHRGQRRFEMLGLERAASLGDQFADKQALGLVVLDVVVAPAAAPAVGQPPFLPAVGRIDGAAELLRIDEGLDR